MKYALALIAGIWIGLAIYRLPHWQPFRNEPPPATPAEWKPKMTGSWSEDEIRTTHGYFSGGVNR